MHAKAGNLSSQLGPSLYPSLSIASKCILNRSMLLALQLQEIRDGKVLGRQPAQEAISPPTWANTNPGLAFFPCLDPREHSFEEMQR